LTLEEYLFQTGIEPEIQFNLFHNLFSNEKETIPKLYDLKAILENLLIYGLFPNSINHPQDRLYLKNFVDSIIYKDLLGTGLIENQRVASDLLKLLAYQIGNLVNYSELATKLGVDQRTINRYIQIFEDSFLIVRIPPFIPNPRDAVVKSDKIYFLDLGIRNALLEDYNDIRLRPDAGALFENFIIIEVLKANLYMNANYHLHFWRSRQGSEVDLILTKGKEIYAVEIKMSKQKKNRAFMNKFPEAKFTSITMENLL
ncbi:MAG: DUF4143 domain-containing protein, partial [Leptospiraceae bacterium]|nr:DUF4143 domain-containing protein [Leptospiraceae bacterium]